MPEEKRYKTGAWKYIRHKKVREWARNKEQERLSGTETKNKKEGHTYIFSLGYDNLYKIGCAYNIEKRLKTFRTSNPNIKCVWSAWSPDMAGLEKKLHRHFKDHRIHGEVFRLCTNDIITANQMANNFR